MGAAARRRAKRTMIKVLVLLIAVTMSCGVAAAVTISLAHQPTERVADGYGTAVQ